MLFTSLLVAAATLSSFASAQNETEPSNLPPGIQPCCTVDPNVIPDELKMQWCQAQRNTCPEICGGVNQLARTGQTCDQETLEFTCECRNGTKPEMALYQQSVPGQMCRFWFDQCINATNENLEFQVECQNQRDTRCGNLTTADGEDDEEEPTASGSPSATPTGGDSEEPEATGAPSATPSGAANALGVARNYGTPLLAGAIAALFGLAL